MPIPEGKPKFDHVILMQHNTGYWHANVKAHLAGCFTGKQTECSIVRKLLSQLRGKVKCDLETIYVTLLGIFVLTEVYSEKEEQWVLLVRKAKNFLKENGIKNPDKLVRAFNLQIE